MFMEILALTLSYFSTGCNNQLKTEHNMCLKENETHRTTIHTLKNEKEQCSELSLKCKTEQNDLSNELTKKCNEEKEKEIELLKNKLNDIYNKNVEYASNFHQEQLKSQEIMLIKQNAHLCREEINGINKDHAEKIKQNAHLCREEIKVMSAKHKEEINSCKDKHKYHHRTQIKYAKQCEHPKK